LADKAFFTTFAHPKNVAMNNRRAFDIAFVGLKPGIHKFEYEVNDKFFADYGEQDFSNCSAKIKLALDKKSGFMLLKFDIAGKVDVSCDRCGNTLTLDLWDEFNIVVKMVDEPDQMNMQEEDPDVYYISKGESHISVADWIYEFINLSIPMQKNCGEDEIGGLKCNKEVLAKLAQMQDDAGKDSNPIWKGLEKFKDLGN
jgi:uncharacterized metal-binding protein YceD (DUF177 family)